jgi:hypothetical protein
MTRTAVDPAVPHDNPCAQCGQPIGAPVWSEVIDREVHYVWVCQACDYEFTQIATYRHELEGELDRLIAA